MKELKRAPCGIIEGPELKEPGHAAQGGAAHEEPAAKRQHTLPAQQPDVQQQQLMRAPSAQRQQQQAMRPQQDLPSSSSGHAAQSGGYGAPVSAAGLQQPSAGVWSSVFAMPLRPVARPELQDPPGLSRLELIAFDVLLCDTLPAAERAVSILLDGVQEQQQPSSTLLGFDVEWRPDIKYGKIEHPTALMQLSLGSRCVLLRTCKFMQQGLPQALLERVFGNADATLVTSGASDVGKLRRDFGALDIRCKFVDMQKLAKAQGYKKVGVAGMAQSLLHASFSKSKQLTMTNWEAPQLSLQELKYAALDAICTEQIYRTLLAKQDAAANAKRSREGSDAA